MSVCVGFDHTQRLSKSFEFRTKCVCQAAVPGPGRLVSAGRRHSHCTSRSCRAHKGSLAGSQ
eukprot:6204524-Heterocapsa_arctica.AAC.1